MNPIKSSTFLFKVLACTLVAILIGTLCGPTPSYAQGDFLINRNVGGQLSSQIIPIALKGITVHPDNPGRLEFILDSSNNLPEKDVRIEADRLIKYFLAALTTPQDDIWVNLSPYEHDRIIPAKFSYTEMGRDFLTEDYALKQLTASLIYPESALGKQFWSKVYEKAFQLYGTTNLPINTFNKVWIVPDNPTVYVKSSDVIIIQSRLKVLSEQDFLAKSKFFKNNTVLDSKNAPDTQDKLHQLSADIVKEIVIPEIERQVNESPDFLKLRQIYQSMILATWYKKNLRENILGRNYLDQNKVSGIDIKDKQAKEKIFREYLAVFKKGVFNYIKEEYDSNTQQMIPRKYFSGGLQGVKNVAEKQLSRELNVQERNLLPSDQALIVSAKFIAVVAPQDNTSQPSEIVSAPNDEKRSRFFDSLMASAHPSTGIPILLFGGQPGLGKTTVAQKYRAYLESQGRSAVIINADNLIKPRSLILKQSLINEWLRMPVVPTATRVTAFSKLLVDDQRVESAIQQILGINALNKREGIISVDGLPEMSIHSGTVIIIEGSLSNLMFGEHLPVKKKVFFRATSGLSTQTSVSELEVDNFDAIVETNEAGQEIFTIKDYAMAGDKNIEKKSFNGWAPANTYYSKFYIGFPAKEVNSLAHLSQMIGDALSINGNNYFQTDRTIRVAIGYDANSVSKERAELMSRILSANGTAVTLIDTETQPFMVAELTQKGDKIEDSYDLAFHISNSNSQLEVRIYEKGITAYLSFQDFLAKPEFFYKIIRGYKQYKTIEAIPAQLFRKATVRKRLEQKLSVFDVEALKAEIPSFIAEMGAQGITNFKAADIERTLTTYGLDDQRVGSLDLMPDLEGSHTSSIIDINGAQIDPMDLAAIFIYYLHSIGESGDIVKTSPVSRSIDSMAQLLGVNLVKLTQGEERLLQYPKSLFALIAIGNMHFSYRGRRFTSFPAAEKLLALEIMLKHKKTLSQYFDSIRQNLKQTRQVQSAITPETIIDGRMYTMMVPFEVFKRKIAQYQVDSKPIGFGVAEAMGWDPDGGQLFLPRMILKRHLFRTLIYVAPEIGLRLEEDMQPQKPIHYVFM